MFATEGDDTLATQSGLEREIQAEQAYVDLALSHLRRAMASAKGLAQESRARYTSDRETWLREEDGTALFERDAFAFLAARRLAALDTEHEGLVFGRLDFTDAEIRYIGRLGVRTPDYEPLVIDWRAPAAEPFYRATPAQPMEVVRRRVLSCRNDKVIGIEDDVLAPDKVPDAMAVIGDGALMRALERARGAHMHDIVATIQAEQDEAIRAPYQGLTMITGGPGTGKTVVALHRAAFLLYTHRRRLANGGVLVIGPSPVFMDYIERVLPSLGEDSVTLNSVGQIAQDVLGFSSSVRGADPAWVIKGGLNMVAALRRLVAHRGGDTSGLVVIVKGEPTSLDARALARIRRDVMARSAYNEARGHAETEIVTALRNQAQPVLDTVDPARIEDLIRSSWAFSNFMERWWPPLAPGQVLARLADPALAGEVTGLPADQAEVLAASIDPENWTVADIPLLDELAHILGPLPAGADEDEINLWSNNVEDIVTISERLTDTRTVEPGTPHATYAHILVDEAQDVTPMQWRMIFRRGPNASWTIVHDPGQSSWPDPDEPVRAMADIMGSRTKRSFRLSTNYRSPKEAYDLATAYITSHESIGEVPVAVRSTGRPPKVVVTPGPGLGAAVAHQARALLEDVEGTVAVIRPAELAPGIDGMLEADGRLSVLDPISSKGLEFDGVIVVDPDRIAASSVAGARTLYVVLTRATQALIVVDVDTPGNWRADVDPMLYEAVCQGDGTILARPTRG